MGQEEKYMDEYIKEISEKIEDKKEYYAEISDKIWEYAEPRFQEYKSSELLQQTLKKEGFSIKSNLAGEETAFIAEYGSGKPVIGFLGEFDALPGLSQKADTTERIPEEKTSDSKYESVPEREKKQNPGSGYTDNCGHGCGHQLIGTGTLAAVIALKDFMKEHNLKGTIRYYGCPAEENAGGKAFLVRDGYFNDCDLALCWHPEQGRRACYGSTKANFRVFFTFHGTPAHASMCPELGRSALDAVELMDVGVNYMREHMIDEARIHYAITDAGGCSPNVVQPRASVLYMVRSNHVAEAVELQKRVDKIAEGAALMTETTYEKKFIDGLADTVSNFALERVLYKNFEELGVPEYTEEENAYADALAETYDSSGVPGVAAENDENAKEQVEKMQKEYGHAMNGFLTPLYQKDAFKAGSTDVGDVSWLTPTAQIHVAAWPNGCPGHSWQNVSCDRTEIGHKAAVHAGKVIAATAIDLIEDTSLLDEARAEFEKRTKDGFVCPIPADAVPVIPD